jgi:uncharacterized SAM-dependent methyltransferase
LHLVGLGCGGGHKDTHFIRRLQSTGGRVVYTPMDVSVSMVLVARQAASAAIPGSDCHPLVGDLSTMDDLAAILELHKPVSALRIFTFFGMIPNFEPGVVLPRLASIVGPKDTLLFSANLAPGPDYEAGMHRILPQYDNDLTRNWLLTFLENLGIDRQAGAVHFQIEDVCLEDTRTHLKRVIAQFKFHHLSRVQLDSELFEFLPGEVIRLFFSYRYTRQLISDLLKRRGLEVSNEWITKSEEEGVFLCHAGQSGLSIRG